MPPARPQSPRSRARIESGSELPAVGGAAGVAAYLRQAILDGFYRFGDRLPAERRLAAGVSCSRATVREALSILERNGFVTRRRGSGTFVSHRTRVSERDVAEITSPLQLVDVRAAVEPHMVRLAAINATAREIERIEEILVALEKSDADPDNFSKWDQHFHQCLADATKNPLMMSLYEQINDVRAHAQWDAMKGKVLTPVRIEEYNRQHRALFTAVAGRDVESATRIIDAHLNDARTDLLAN